MTQVRLRPMTAEEYRDWRPWAIQDYAREDVEHKAVDPDRARANMAAFLESVIPRGPRTEGHRLSIVEDAETGERVGYTWWADRELDAGPAAWIYDVYIDEPHRGTGVRPRPDGGGGGPGARGRASPGWSCTCGWTTIRPRPCTGRSASSRPAWRCSRRWVDGPPGLR